MCYCKYGRECEATEVFIAHIKHEYSLLGARAVYAGPCSHSAMAVYLFAVGHLSVLAGRVGP